MELDEIREKGFLSFTFSPVTDLYPAVKEENAKELPILLKGSFKLVLFIKTSIIQIGLKLFPEMPHFVTGSMTSLKKDHIYTAAFKWDGNSDSQFSFYLNGLYNGVEHWQLPGYFKSKSCKGDYITPDNGQFIRAIDLTLKNGDYTEEEFIKSAKHPDCSEITDESRTADTSPLFPLKPPDGDIIISSEFSETKDLDDWLLEGQGSAEIHDGMLEMTPGAPGDIPNHLVLWNKNDLPENFLAEWDFIRSRDSGLAIAFFCALGINGEDILTGNLAPRDGDFKKYHHGDFNCYHISYFAYGRTTCNLRKNYGMFLGAIGNDLVSNYPADEKVRVSLFKMEGNISLGINGKTALRYHDDGVRYGNILGTGKFGFRQMAHTGSARYGNFSVRAI
ncbi:MAG: DUF1961 family protein [Fibrobacterota bacterium]